MSVNIVWQKVIQLDKQHNLVAQFGRTNAGTSVDRLFVQKGSKHVAKSEWQPANAASLEFNRRHFLILNGDVFECKRLA